MSKFPKTVAAVQKRDRCMWEIGDALLAECGPLDRDSQSRSYHDGSRAKRHALADHDRRRTDPFAMWMEYARAWADLFNIFGRN